MTFESKIAVVEARWGEEDSVSVRSMFELLCYVQYRNSSLYYYEMFCNGDALKNIVMRVGSRSDIKYLYIAAHGTDNGICGSDGTLISRTVLRNILLTLNEEPSGNLYGLFVGSCLFGQSNNAQFLLEEHNGMLPRLLWVAGYNTVIPWVESMGLDMLFWDQLLAQEEPSMTKQKAIRSIKKVAGYLSEMAKGLVSSLKFSIFIRNSRGEIVDLFAKIHEC